MNSQKNQLTTQLNQLCKECNLFFGCDSFNGYCSSCFKYYIVSYFRKNQAQQLDNQVEEKPQLIVKARICKVQFVREINGKEYVVSNRFQKVQVDKSKCFACSKKIGLLGVECKCNFIFCNSHRLPQDHHCEINYKDQGKKKLES